MNGFSVEWLMLRERADAAARCAALVSFIEDRVDGGRALDLGGGTGANVRYLSSRLSGTPQWVVVDNDASLLARVPRGVATCVADLNTMVADPTCFRGCRLVTASALLDLVSDRWLVQLVEQCSAATCPVLFALSYDGRFDCAPLDPDDADIRTLVNEHQKSDKGFGPALGPHAAARAVELLSASGYDVRHGQSDWTLAPDDTALQIQLVLGWAVAAAEMDPRRHEAIDAWRDRRLALIEAKRSRIVVGHVDVAGVPGGR